MPTKKRLFFFLPAFLLAACSAAQFTNPSASSIDAHYSWNRFAKKVSSSNESISTKSQGVRFYQNIASQTLGSHCSHFPSDSSYTQAIFAQCGALSGVVHGMSRFLLEPDSANLGLPVITTAKKIYYQNFTYACP